MSTLPTFEAGQKYSLPLCALETLLDHEDHLNANRSRWPMEIKSARIILPSNELNINDLESIERDKDIYSNIIALNACYKFNQC